MLCLVDSSVLIDLGYGGVLLQLFRLEVKLAAPELVLDELVKPDRERLQEMGLERADLIPEQLLEAQAMATNDGRLSVADCAVFIAAREGNTTLLTGDGRLRRLAKERGVSVHGALWVLDRIEAAYLLEAHALTACLRRMLANGARLPSEACDRRLRHWESKRR